MVATTRRRMSAHERRAAILAVAGPLFARDGYEQTRLDDLAAAAGVTKPIVYRHFAGKKALYLALLARHAADLPGFMALGGVREILEGWLAYVRANQHAWVMLFRDHSGDEEIRAFRVAVSARAREVMVDYLVAQAGDRIPPAQRAPTAELVISGLAGLALWWIDHPDVPRDVLVEAAARVFEPLLGPPAAAHGRATST
jgi:AcrR family transcriptional regulator